MVNRPDGFSITSSVIQSTKNALVQSVAKLHRASFRREKKLFLLDGTHLLIEAIDCRWPLQSIYATADWYEMHRNGLLTRAPRETSVHLVSPHVLSHIASTESPDGVLAIARFRENEDVSSSSALPSPPTKRDDVILQVAVDGLQDPGNLGALLRTSVAANASGLFLGAGSVDPYHPKVLRSTAGQWFRMPPRSIDLPNHIEQCKRQGIRVYAAAASGTNYWSLDFTQPSLFVLGNEGAGVSTQILQMVDSIVSIPMANGVESLNVAMAGALLLYEARRQRNFHVR